jgi:WD40 repeat protein
MATINSVTSAQNTQFDLLNIGTFPQEILHNIFSNALNYKDIHSLLCTCHHFRWAISNWTPFWTTLLENYFPGSYTPSPDVKPIDVYNDCLELENTIRSGSGICKHDTLSSGGGVRCIIEHEGKLITANGVNIEIWKDERLQKRFPLQRREAVDAMVAYKDKLFVASIELIPTKISAYDTLIKVYDLNSGELLGNLKGHRGQISNLCKNENRLYSSDYSPGAIDCTIKIWDMDTLREYGEIKPGAWSLLSHKNTLFFGNWQGEIRAWDPNTHKCDVFHQYSENSNIDKMLIHGDKFISIIKSETISVINFISKQHLYSAPNLFRVSDLLGFGRLLFSARDDGVSVIAWDLNAGKKLMQHMFTNDRKGRVSSSSMAFSKGKLYVTSRTAIHVFDFAEPIKYKKKLELLTSMNGKLRTGEKFTPLHMEALQLAIAQKNRNEIIACVDNLIAVDPKNEEFCEFLCEVTQGIDIPLYEFLEGRDFDHREILRKADFDNIKTATDKFTEKLKTDRNIVVRSIPLFDQFSNVEPEKRFDEVSTDQSDESNDVAMEPSESESED